MRKAILFSIILVLMFQLSSALTGVSECNILDSTICGGNKLYTCVVNDENKVSDINDIPYDFIYEVTECPYNCGYITIKDNSSFNGEKSLAVCLPEQAQNNTLVFVLIGLLVILIIYILIVKSKRGIH